MPFGASRKVPNLLLKHLARWEGMPQSTRQRILPWLHVPWDQHSLRWIAPVLSPGMHIPSKVTMNYVTSSTIYDELQRAARRLAREAGVPAIYMDVLAFDERRRPTPHGAR